MLIYAISDIHGCLEQFEYSLELIDLSDNNMLILLGDYIHGPNSYGVLNKIMDLQNKYGRDKVIALMGNHEEMAIRGRWAIDEDRNQGEEDDRYITWMMSLPYYYVTDQQIFCHAGIDEEAEDMWEYGTDDYTFIEKFPAETGEFYMDIIAGHVGTSVISQNPRYHDIYFDGQSHYYIDGTVLESGIIPVIAVDTEQNKYYSITETGQRLIFPYDDEN
ncbi:metallophosphoesterase [Terrisporobacter petrolearius]|uniref:metallophosphoesterase n=1 Tax=Terrisporobacter petrolearius TaxID=1460447 RepID=UPI001D166151|nr:metallophosphoesterase [Terrisporobacter petrolearius]MCC3865673.1 metallophosphoesterase [Terrisporobacter petrolearius]